MMNDEAGPDGAATETNAAEEISADDAVQEAAEPTESVDSSDADESEPLIEPGAAFAPPVAADEADNAPAPPDVTPDVEPVAAEPAPEPAAAEVQAEEPDPEPDVLRFVDLGLHPQIVRALDELGYEEPTPIQRETIPLVMSGTDLLGQAATGTGKTAAFALPILNQIDVDDNAVQALVLAPTRELAVQVAEAMYRYGRHLGVRVVPVFGGQPIQRQLRSLDRGAHIVVATPGRAVDHIGRGSLRLDGIRTVVLDEADEMLDMGFADDIEAILESTPEERQTVLFSATMPPRIRSIGERFQRNPQRVVVGQRSNAAEPSLIRQVVYFVRRADKPFALGRVLDVEAPEAALVFCRTRTEVDQLTETMNARGYRAEALHGGMDQTQRDRVMGRLRDGTAELLVATDVAARGLDVSTLTHVVNYDVPSAPESYTHRIGRVGRAGRTGTAITFAEPRERRLIGNIERRTKSSIESGRVPSVADLRSRQIELTVNAVRESSGGDDLDDFSPILEALLADGKLDEGDVALAALKLVHELRGAVTDEREIPEINFDEKPRRDKRDRFDRDNRRDRGRDDRGRNDRGRDDRGRNDRGRDDRGDRGRNDRGRDDWGRNDRGRDDRGDRGRNDRGRNDRGRNDRGGDPDTGFVYVGSGRNAGLRPADLVGAIANESGLTGRQIGPIRISDHFSVVGVPRDKVDDVVSRMRNAVVRGRTVKVRPYVD